jgi:hypothetical protein
MTVSSVVSVLQFSLVSNASLEISVLAHNLATGSSFLVSICVSQMEVQAYHA